ncbi:histidine kinase [Paenibacillus marchantiophytorum]|uniref:Histidine kinase n=2 Tax=Paenibacillus marchantiophytorum TaxID=1619310 RepID=A0ABQ2BU14_9BACL|nr:histidine kinase [Paenibacillus marchantiophytorum]
MRNLHERLSRKLVNKIILLLSFVIVLIVGSLTIISTRITENEAMKNMVTTTKNNLKLVNQNFDNYFFERRQFIFPQYQYEQVINSLQNEDLEYTSQQYLEDYLRVLFYSKPDIQGVYLYVIKKNKYYYITHDENESKVRIAVNQEIPSKKWFQEALQNDQQLLFSSLLTSTQGDVGYPVDINKSFMAYHRAIRTIFSKESKAIISIFFNTTVRDQIIRDASLDPNEHIVLLSHENVPFYWDDPAFFQSMELDWNRIGKNDNTNSIGEKGDNQYFDIWNMSERGQWKLIKFITSEQIYKAAHASRNISYAVGLIFLIISITLIALTTNAITRPLNKLSNHMLLFSIGNFNVRVPVKGNDEIAHISKQFNNMILQTNNLIEEQYKLKLVQQSAILKALEAEINPHFLYNALQAISTKALKSNIQDIVDMVDALASTLRYCFSGGDQVKLNEELKHIENYLILQKARFGSRLRIQYRIDPQLEQLFIPRLSVQTLVENSIKHALEKVSYEVCIVIEANISLDGVTIKVTDNGPGISSERLQFIKCLFQKNWEDREYGSIGLQNLHARLKLRYGQDAEVVIHTQSFYTEVCIKLPKGGMEHVKGTDY